MFEVGPHHDDQQPRSFDDQHALLEAAGTLAALHERFARLRQAAIDEQAACQREVVLAARAGRDDVTRYSAAAGVAARFARMAAYG